MSGYLKENKDKTGKTISFRIGAARAKDADKPGKYGYVFKTVKTDSVRVAQKALRDLQTQIDNNLYVEPGKQTLKEYLETWLRDYCKPNLAPNTTETYDIMVHKHIAPAIGAIELTALKPNHIQRLISDKTEDGYSNRTVQYICSTLSKALKIALKTPLISRNPMDSVTIPKVRRHEFKTMNENDIGSFLNAAKSTEYHALFYTALYCGMRRSELLGLTWQDVDLYVMQLSINRTLHHLLNGQTIIRQPKTDKSRRMIALSPSNCVVLREHRARQDRQRTALGLPPTSDSDLVFCQWDGKPYLPNSITHAWIKLVRKNGLTGIRLHDARHTMASIMLKNGIHPKIVQERLGHAKISTTLDTYSHVAPGLQAAAAAKLDDILQPKENKLEKELSAIIQN